MTRIRRVTSEKAPEPPPESFSNCLVVDGIAYISGQVARPAEGESGLSDYEQARRIFDRLEALLTAAGGSLADVVKMTVFMTDIRRRDEIWQARKDRFTGDFPASTLVEISKLADPALTVEIEVIAHIGASKG